MPPTTQSAGTERLRIRRELGCVGCPHPRWGIPTGPGRRAASRHARHVRSGVPRAGRGTHQTEVRTRANRGAPPRGTGVSERCGTVGRACLGSARLPGRKDNRYLELALAARADAIVSGDDDLLVLHPWRGIQVLRPTALSGIAYDRLATTLTARWVAGSGHGALGWQKSVAKQALCPHNERLAALDNGSDGLSCQGPFPLGHSLIRTLRGGTRCRSHSISRSRPSTA